MHAHQAIHISAGGVRPRNDLVIGSCEAAGQSKGTARGLVIAAIDCVIQHHIDVSIGHKVQRRGGESCAISHGEAEEVRSVLQTSRL